MKLIKVLAAIAVPVMLLACSMNSEKPVFLPSDGDYIGQKLEMLGYSDPGKFEKAYLQISPEPDGSYVIATTPPTDKESGHIVLKAVQKIPDGIMYAVQLTKVPRFLPDGTMSKLSYDIHPVKITSDGTVFPMEFGPSEKSIKLAKRYRLNIVGGMFEQKLNEPFNRVNAQCYIQKLIEDGQYKLVNKDKPVMMRLVGYSPPKEIGISGCE